MTITVSRRTVSRAFLAAVVVVALVGIYRVGRAHYYDHHNLHALLQWAQQTDAEIQRLKNQSPNAPLAPTEVR